MFRNEKVQHIAVAKTYVTPEFNLGVPMQFNKMSSVAHGQEIGMH